jgi:ABC-type sugar transport system permease subunit
MNTTPAAEARPPQNRRVKRRLALVSFLVALYPPLVVVASAVLLPLAHQRDVQICKTLYTPSGIAKQYCEIHNTSPLFGVVSVLTFLIFPAILATLVGGHLALYHQQPADGAKSQRIFAIIGLVLGYTWAALAALVWLMAANAE